MNGINFDPKLIPIESFDQGWQTQIGITIRLASVTVGKTKDELRNSFISDPQAMVAFTENLSAWTDKLEAYRDILNCAMARLLTVGCEIEGIPLEDEAGE